MTWLITLARNLAIDKLSARKATAVDIDEVQDLRDGGPTPQGRVRELNDQFRSTGQRLFLCVHVAGLYLCGLRHRHVR